MSRGFNEQEKLGIKQSLMNEGRILFSQYGLKKTSIIELAEAAGIASGSFYTFFNSKEELYFEILEKEEEVIKSEFVKYDFKGTGSPKQAMKYLIKQTFTMIDENPLFNKLLFDNNHDALLRKLPVEKLEAHMKKDTDMVRLVATKWKEAGIIRDIDEDVLAGLFRALFAMSLHKKEIGEKVYPQTLELLTDFIINGLVVEGG
jgi:AcrR family transcriptional regulator